MAEPHPDLRLGEDIVDDAEVGAVLADHSSLEAILARNGERQIDPAELRRRFGSLPSDDEG